MSYFQLLAEKTGIPFEEITEKWAVAELLCSDKGEDAMSHSIVVFKQMMKLEEQTVAGDIPAIATKPDEVIMRRNCYHVNNDLFWKLHKTKREDKQWYSKFYEDPRISEYARKNPNTKFYIKNTSDPYGMIREI